LLNNLVNYLKQYPKYIAFVFSVCERGYRGDWAHQSCSWFQRPHMASSAWIRDWNFRRKGKFTL